MSPIVVFNRKPFDESSSMALFVASCTTDPLIFPLILSVSLLVSIEPASLSFVIEPASLSFVIEPASLSFVIEPANIAFVTPPSLIFSPVSFDKLPPLFNCTADPFTFPPV